MAERTYRNRQPVEMESTGLQQNIGEKKQHEVTRTTTQEDPILYPAIAERRGVPAIAQAYRSSDD